MPFRQEVLSRLFPAAEGREPSSSQPNGTGPRALLSIYVFRSAGPAGRHIMLHSMAAPTTPASLPREARTSRVGMVLS